MIHKENSFRPHTKNGLLVNINEVIIQDIMRENGEYVGRRVLEMKA